MDILIVDDEKGLRHSLSAYLEDEGLRPKTASNYAETMELVRHCDFQIGIIDMRLPDTDGNTLIEELHKVCPKMRFIIHTGSVNYTLPDQLRDIGIRSDCVFQKPVSDIAVFLAAIKKIEKQLAGL